MSDENYLDSCLLLAETFSLGDGNPDGSSSTPDISDSLYKKNKQVF